MKLIKLAERSLKVKTVVFLRTLVTFRRIHLCFSSWFFSTERIYGSKLLSGKRIFSPSLFAFCQSTHQQTAPTPPVILLGLLQRCSNVLVFSLVTGITCKFWNSFWFYYWYHFARYNLSTTSTSIFQSSTVRCDYWQLVIFQN